MGLAGIEGVDTTHGLRLNVADHALDAASEGMGVVLAYKVVAARDIMLKRLVSPFGPQIPVPGRAYYFVCTRGQEKRPPIKAFRDWVFAEMEETHASLNAALPPPSATDGAAAALRRAGEPAAPRRPRRGEGAPPKSTPAEELP
jgi:LysR family glycine cleavage system transcriptional activator